jgi:hypothetical protein
VSKPGSKPTPHEVKDSMVRREADWLKTLGGTVSTREIESRVNRGLERLYARRREAVPEKLRPTKPQSNDRQQRTLDRLTAKSGGEMWIKPAAPIRQRGPRCKWCGVCVDCKRASRLRTIQTLGRQGDTDCAMMSWDFVALVNAFTKGSAYRDVLGRAVNFADMRPAQRRKVFVGAIESICDRSVSKMGAWR